MKSLRMKNVTFALTFLDHIKGLNKPRQWPDFLGHLIGLLDHVKDQEAWDIIFEFPECNKGANQIA